MKTAKIVLVHDSIARSPWLRGDQLVVAVAIFGKPRTELDLREALRLGDILFSKVRSTGSDLARAGLEAVTTLMNKMARQEVQVLASLTREKAFAELRVAGRKILVLPDVADSEDLRLGRQVLECCVERELESLELEYPMIPWRESELEPHLQALREHGDLGFYKIEHPDLAATWAEVTRRKKILLHICCGPDAAGVINQLKRDFEVVCFWYDPNIQPREEHDKRLEAFEQVAKIENVPYIVGEYDVDEFYRQIRGLEHTPEQGAKCSICYDMRLERAAAEAKKQGCDLYTTTLAISPHKVQAKLKAFGELNEKKYGIPYLARNFMKDEGFKKSVEYTRDYNIYRQDYCGCYFSLHEGGPQAQSLAESLGFTKADLKTGFVNPYLDLSNKKGQ